jgi:hypothetical protein
MFRTVANKTFCILIVALVMSSCALAQYGGGGMGTTPASGGTYNPSSRSYGHGAAIGAGVGAGAGAALLLFGLRHRHNQVVGCVAPDGKTLTTDDGKHAYQLAGNEVTAGERLSLIGKKSKNEVGADQLEVRLIKKDFGQCGRQQAGLVERHP